MFIGVFQGVAMEFEAEVGAVHPVMRPNGEKAVQVILTSPAPPLPQATEKKPVPAKIDINIGQMPGISFGEEVRIVLNISLKEWEQLKQKFVFGDFWSVSVEGKRITVKKKRGRRK